MTAKTLGRALIVAAAFVSLNGMANTLPAAKLKEMMSFQTMDVDRDGKVSRAEFVEMMGKIYDMHAKDGAMDAARLDSLYKAITAARR